MSWLSCVVIVLTFYAPPLELSEQICCKNVAVPISLWNFGLSVSGRQAQFLTLMISWLVIWALISFTLRLVAPNSVQEWIEGVINTKYPAAITRVILALSVTVLVLAFGGLQIINSALRTAFSIGADTVILALFTLVAEIGRAIEVARRDEDAWRRLPRRRANSA